tara:strand:- start:667 stop:1680 length:1014 start_codon:yes stop_codon:yes gene_type:complete
MSCLGYSSVKDMFDGGGKGKSGDSFSTEDNSALDTDNDGNISSSEAVAGTGSANLAGGLDGTGSSSPTNTGGSSGSDAETALITSDLDDDEFWEEFEAGTSGMNTNTGNVTSSIDSNNETAASFYDADTATDNVLTNNNVITTGGGNSNTAAVDTSTSTNDDTTNNTTTTNDDTTNNTTTTNDDTTNNTTTTNNNSLIDDLNNQIADLQNQLNSMNSGGGNTIVYEGAGDTNTSLPDDYLTEADLAKYLDNLDLGSNAYDPAAFLNAYGFALDPTMMGNLIPTMQGNNGLFVRRAVKDKETGEIRYVNVPIGPGATGGNQGLSQFQMERRAGFGNLL